MAVFFIEESHIFLIDIVVKELSNFLQMQMPVTISNQLVVQLVVVQLYEDNMRIQKNLGLLNYHKIDLALL